MMLAKICDNKYNVITNFDNDKKYCCICLFEDTYKYIYHNDKVFINQYVSNELGMDLDFFMEKLKEYNAMASATKDEHRDYTYHYGGHLFSKISDAQRFLEDVIEPQMMIKKLVQDNV